MIAKFLAAGGLVGMKRKIAINMRFYAPVRVPGNSSYEGIKKKSHSIIRCASFLVHIVRVISTDELKNAIQSIFRSFIHSG